MIVLLKRFHLSGYTIVTRGTGMKPCKFQRPKQRCCNFMLKFYDCAQSFVLRSHTMAKLLSSDIFFGSLLMQNSNPLLFVHRVKAKTVTKT